ARFDDRLTGRVNSFAVDMTVAHVDVDPAEIGKVIKTDIPVVGDAKKTLEMLLRFDQVETDFKEWTTHVLDNKRRAPFAYDEDENFVKPQEVIEIIG
ncbi:acetolactate synthase large subunit, partial [Streptococcus pyogenes]